MIKNGAAPSRVNNGERKILKVYNEEKVLFFRHNNTAKRTIHRAKKIKTPSSGRAQIRSPAKKKLPKSDRRLPFARNVMTVSRIMEKRRATRT